MFYQRCLLHKTSNSQELIKGGISKVRKVPIILVATLLSVILVLPTLLVIPFAEASTKVDEQVESEPVTETETPSEEPVVSVFRQESEVVEEVHLKSMLLSWSLRKCR